VGNGKSSGSGTSTNNNSSNDYSTTNLDRADSALESTPISDNWIYIQEPDVKLGRLQIFNNWSPYMVADQSKIWLG